MIGAWIMIAVFAVVCALNCRIGYGWTRLDHNPWSGKFLGGSFSGPTPGWNPGALEVAEIRRRGRRLMIATPIIFALATLLITYLTYRGRSA